MRAKEKPPTEGSQLVVVDRDRNLYKWYHVAVEELGELVFEGPRQWRGADGQLFNSAHDVLEKMNNRRREHGTELRSASYAVPGIVRAVHSAADHILIETSQGVIRIDFVSERKVSRAS